MSQNFTIQYPQNLTSMDENMNYLAPTAAQVLNFEIENDIQETTSKLLSTSEESSYITIANLTQNQTKLKNLLESWDLLEMLPKCIELQMTVEAFLCMSDYYKDKFLQNFPLGNQIIFSNHHKKWLSTLQSTADTETSELSLSSLTSSSSKCSPHQTHSTKVFNISSILNESTNGKYILDYYKNNNKINEGVRKMLTTEIINFLIKNDFKMSVSLANDVTEKIIEQFPTETKALYFFKEDGKAPLGIIYTKYFNTIRKLYKVGIKTVYHKRDSSTPIPELDIPDTAETAESLKCLHADNLTWPEVELHWSNTVSERIKFIKSAQDTESILLRWPHYKKPLGYKLVEMDFEILYQHKHNFTDIFPEFKIKMLPILQTKVKHADGINLLNSLIKDENMSENGQMLCVVHLLHHVLTPTTREVRHVNGKKIHVKFTIQDSQHSFMLLGATSEELNEKLRLQSATSKFIQPLLLVSGMLTNPKEIMVYFDGVYYKLFSIGRAIDVCFAITHLFNLQYPLASRLVWIFIQHYFYQIKIKSEKGHPSITYLIEQLNDI